MITRFRLSAFFLTIGGGVVVAAHARRVAMRAVYAAAGRPRWRGRRGSPRCRPTQPRKKGEVLFHAKSSQ